MKELDAQNEKNTKISIILNQDKRQKEAKRCPKKRKKFKNNKLPIYYLFILIISILSKGYFSYSSISLKIATKGNIKVYGSNGDFPSPDEIYINQVK